MIETDAFGHFDEAAHAILDFLHSHFGFGLWMVTRVQGDDWIILQARDQSAKIDDGTVLRWSDSFCSRMTRDEGPSIATTAEALRPYSEAPIGEAMTIGAYMGVPLHRANGKLFGTLCAVDARERPEIREEDARPILELMGRILSTLLAHELRLAEQEQLTRTAFDEAQTDELTGLPNRRGWGERIDHENRLLKNIAGSATVLIIDLDELKEVNDTRGHQAGDQLIRSAGDALNRSMRDEDFMARIGGDEFAVLSTGTRKVSPDELVERLRDQLRQHEVAASIGAAEWQPGKTLEDAWREADEAMYEDKRRRSGEV